MKTVNSVIVTNDYSSFLRLEGNRSINKCNLKRIKKSMMTQQLISPIIVNEKMEIIDGQHRFVAQKELDLPVYYILQNGYGRKETQIFNSCSKDWTTDDYMNSYCDTGIVEYLEYRDFYQMWKFSHNECMNMLNGTIHERGLHDVFKFGTFKIKKRKIAEKNAERITMMEKHYDGWKRRSFVQAMLICFENKRFNFIHFCKKLRYQSSKLVDCVSYNDHLKIIEEIYNYKIRTQNKLRLF